MEHPFLMFLDHTGGVIKIFRGFPQFLNLYSVNSRKVVSAVKPKVHQHDTHKFSPYRVVNTLRLGYKTSHLMLCREIIAVCSQIHTKHIHFSSLSYDRSEASSKASSPHSAIQSFLFQMRVSSPFL